MPYICGEESGSGVNPRFRKEKDGSLMGRYSEYLFTVLGSPRFRIEFFLQYGGSAGPSYPHMPVRGEL